MIQSEVPAVVEEWVKLHPVAAAIAAVILLGVVVVIAVRHGDITNWP
jgi:NADH:ubiquinone oxidoreductase subunit 6 (subunit J)